MMPDQGHIVPDHGDGWQPLPRGSPLTIEAIDNDAAACKPLATSSEAAPGSASQRRSTTQRATHLPLELLEVIIPLACSPRCSTSAPHIDTKTVARIALVSKRLYRYALPLLYTYVTLARPSQVILYARTILDRPDLARMTKTLWIGPNLDTLLSPFWWPLNASRTAIRSSLTDPSELPRGVAVGQWWSVVMYPKESASQKDACAAVAELINCAWRQLDAVMEGPKGFKTASYLPEPLRRSSTSEWRLKAFQVQRMLDGYLKAWRRRQDTTLLALRYGSEAEQAIGSAMSRGACIDNGDWPDPKAWVVNEPLNKGTIHRDPCDFFDHPTIYERSKWGQIFDDATEGIRFVWPSGGSSHRRSRSKPGALASDKTARSLLSQIVVCKATVSDIIEACKIVIVRLPQLRALAFTGYTVATLSDAFPVVHQADLKKVFIGPTPLFVPLRLAQGQQIWSSVQTITLSGELGKLSDGWDWQTGIVDLRFISFPHRFRPPLCDSGDPSSCQVLARSEDGSLELLDSASRWDERRRLQVGKTLQISFLCTAVQ